jgi:hypothetical protein
MHCSVLIPPSMRTTVRTSYSNLRLRELEMAQISPHNPLSLPPNTPFPRYPAGTGKTATFAVGILQRLDVEVKQCQALVLAPTRELAQQIVKVIGALGDFMNLKIHACVGGTAVRDDIRTLQDGVHIVVGTPGRVYDMIQRRALRLDSVQLFGTYALLCSVKNYGCL